MSPDAQALLSLCLWHVCYCPTGHKKRQGQSRSQKPRQTPPLGRGYEVTVQLKGVEHLWLFLHIHICTLTHTCACTRSTCAHACTFIYSHPTGQYSHACHRGWEVQTHDSCNHLSVKGGHAFVNSQSGRAPPRSITNRMCCQTYRCPLSCQVKNGLSIGFLHAHPVFLFERKSLLMVNNYLYPLLCELCIHTL